jgi:integrase
MARIPKPWKREKTGTWHVQIDGKQVSLGKNKSEAWAKYNRLMAQVTGKASNLTARQIILAYWDWLKGNRKPTTASSREKILKSFGDSLPANLKAESVKPFHVQAWIDGNPNIKSPTTANHRISIIVGVFSWAEKFGYISKNPLAKMPKPRRRIRQEFVSADLWPRVLELATDEHFKTWLWVMLSTGCRVQEMFKFEPDNYDPVGKRFVLPIEDSKGCTTSRVIYLPIELVSTVEQLVHECPEGEKLFRNRRGQPWNRNSIRCRFRRLKRELNMPKLTATTLRHSFAHHRLSSGQDALTVSKLMGHVDTRMLATRYGHLEQNENYMQQAANAVSFPTMPSTTPNQTA